MKMIISRKLSETACDIIRKICRHNIGTEFTSDTLNLIEFQCYIYNCLQTLNNTIHSMYALRASKLCSKLFV